MLIIKHSNRRNQHLGTDEIVPTTICLLEQTLKAGPFLTVSNDPGDLEVLTSNQFLQKGTQSQSSPGVKSILTLNRHSDVHNAMQTGYGNRDSTRVCIFGISDQIGQKDFIGVFSTMILSGSLVKILKRIQNETSDTFLVVKAIFDISSCKNINRRNNQQSN